MSKKHGTGYAAGYFTALLIYIVIAGFAFRFGWELAGIILR